MEIVFGQAYREKSSLAAKEEKMTSPNFSLTPRDFGKLAMAGVVEAGRLTIEIGKIIVGVAAMWGIFFIGLPLAAMDRVKKRFKKVT